MCTTVALAPRQQADFLLLVATFEVERGAIGAGVHLSIAQRDQLGAAGDRLPDVVVGLQVIAGLVDVGKLHGIADLDGAGIRGSLALSAF